MKLLIINTHPVNYHVPIYRSLAKEKDINLDVGFLWNVYSSSYQPNAEWPIQYEPDLLQGYNSFFLKNYSTRSSGFFEFINWEVISLISSGKYEAVLLFGYNNLTAWMVALSCRLKKIPLIFKGEGDLSLERGLLKKMFKKIYLGIFFKLIDYFTYSYKKNADYFLHYGVSAEKMHFMPCSVDNEYLQGLSASWSRDLIRQELGFADAKVILFVGKLEQRKNPEVLFEAFKALPEIENAKLVYVGEGTIVQHLKEKCAQDEFLRERVIFAGFKQAEALYRYFKAADVFVLPSFYDPSPKVVNEAMNFSLPILVSSQVGTSGDLVIEGHNGFLFEPTDCEGLRAQLYEVLSNDTLRFNLARNSLATIEKWSIHDNLNCLKKIFNQIELKKDE